MQKMKLNVLICRAPYGGNGGISNEHPSIGNWLIETIAKMKADERVGDIQHVEFSDTPITMVRNRFVQYGREHKADVLLMIDSDQYPDYELRKGDTEAKPFWETSFDFLYNHWHKGPCVIGAPYCGPSPFQNVYVFEWKTDKNNTVNQEFSLAAYTREQAYQMAGIQECAALPTGLILFDIRCFDLNDPPYFYYEWGDQFQSKKVSTEDVTATRDIGMTGQTRLGYNPVFCNWDSWAGHVKQEVVGKPRPLLHEQVSEKYRKAVSDSIKCADKIVTLNADKQSEWKVTGVASGPTEGQAALYRLRQGHSPEDSCNAIDKRTLVRFVEDAVTKHGDCLMVEVGSFLGDTAREIVSANKSTKVVCVDTWLAMNDDSVARASATDDVYAAFMENCKHEIAAGRIEPYRGLSTAVAKLLNTKKNQFDIVYVDASHDYESVKEDILAWLPLVREGGVICGHDFDIEAERGVKLFPGVRKAVEEIFGDDYTPPAPGGCVWSHTVKRGQKKGLVTGARSDFPKMAFPEPRVVERVEQYTSGMKKVLEIGPGKRPLSTATHFVDWDELDLPNLCCMSVDGQRLPFADNEFDFVYCRHTLEDLQNPQLLCDEMSRVAKEGFLQVPSTVAECCWGVDGGHDESPEWRGYIHHRHFVYVDGGALTFLPKMPAVEKLDWRDSDDKAIRKLLNERHANWNESLYWKGAIKHRTLSHDRDFSLNKDYERMVLELAARQPVEILPPESRHETNGHAAKPKRKRKAALRR